MSGARPALPFAIHRIECCSSTPNRSSSALLTIGITLLSHSLTTYRFHPFYRPSCSADTLHRALASVLALHTFFRSFTTKHCMVRSLFHRTPPSSIARLASPTSYSHHTCMASASLRHDPSTQVAGGRLDWDVVDSANPPGVKEMTNLEVCAVLTICVWSIPVYRLLGRVAAAEWGSGGIVAGRNTSSGVERAR